ncbi:MAG: hypothetical protein HY959_14070 [Ignavibacteriae bacterium]|nr:hypothetical protein [Ignavibacteriota bacterium]
MGDPNVFIIESLTRENENEKLMEGGIIKNILNYYKKKTLYHYIRTKKELINILNEFVKSEYKYLHFSCHANEEYIDLTYDRISYSEFATILGTKLKGKRVFFSSCLIANDNFAKEIFNKTECLSIAGFSESIYFHYSAVIWASFYTLIFDSNENKMPKDAIIFNLQKLSNTFLMDINYFQRKDIIDLKLIPKSNFRKYSLTPDSESLEKEIEFLNNELEKKEKLMKILSRIKKDNKR